MRRVLILALALSGVVSAQTVWPNAPDSNATLLVDTNYLGSNLTASVTSVATVFPVTSTANLSLDEEVFVDFEAVKITGISGLVLTVQRGFDHTIAQAHAQRAQLYRLPGAALHNNVTGAILAMQQTPVQVVATTPSGACSPANKMEWVPGGSIYACVAGTWKVVAGGGGGSSATISFTSQTSVPVAYNLGTNNVIATVRDASGTVIPGGYTFTLTEDGNNATLSFATSQSGSITVLSVSSQFFSEVFTNQTSFNVAHNLGTTTPGIAVYNTSGSLLYGATLAPVDSNNSTLSFAVPQSGTVVLVRQ